MSESVFLASSETLTIQYWACTPTVGGAGQWAPLSILRFAVALIVLLFIRFCYLPTDI